MRIKSIQFIAGLTALVLLATPGFTQDDSLAKGVPNFHKVNEKLYRGGQPKRGDLQRLRQLGIKTIVNLRDGDRRADEEGADALRAGLRSFNIPIGRWGRPQDEEIQQVLMIINNPEHQPVFIHCHRGADRTGVVVAVYRIIHDGWSSEQAKAEAKRYGLKPWQFGMKDYIRDFPKRQAKREEF